MPKIKTRLCDMLNLSIPIFQGPMAGAVPPQLASAVANQGGLGMVPLSNWSMADCEKLIDDTLVLTEQAVGVNLYYQVLKRAFMRNIKIVF